jgi:FAD/FMN-containing dehydrogenase
MQNETDYLQIKNDLLNKIKGEIDIRENTKEKYARDASLFYVLPQMIIYPKDKNDIQAIVKYVNENKYKYKDLSVTLRAAGTDMSGGPLNTSIIVDVTKYLNKIKDIAEEFYGEDRREKRYLAVVEPGLYYRDLEKEILKYGLIFPSYPASKDLCCVGGIVSNNSAGEKTLLYGQTVKYIHKLEVVLSNGEMVNFQKISFEKAVQKSKNDTLEGKIYRDVIKLLEDNSEIIKKAKPKVSKNSSGYNLWEILSENSKGEKFIEMQKVVVGSQGTFGIITEIAMELVKIKKHSRMVVVFLPNLQNVVEVTKAILEYKPESLESYDDHTFSIAIKFLPQIIWKLKQNIFKLAFSFIPEAWAVLTGGIPKLIILAEFTGDNEEDLQKKVVEVYDKLKQYKYKAKYTKKESDAEKYWLFRRESFNLLRSKLADLRTAPYIEDTCVPVETLKDFIPAMQEILDRNRLLYTIAGHVGDGNFHIIPLVSLKGEKGENEIRKIKNAMHEVFALVKYFKGSISAEHNDGLIRTPYLSYMFSDNVLDLFKKIKNIFDPKNIFNPNKKVGGSEELTFKLIDRTK